MVEHRLRGESLWLSPFRDPPRPPGTKGMAGHVYVGEVEIYGEREGGEEGENRTYLARPHF